MFTQPCFIRKTDDSIIYKLCKLGYDYIESKQDGQIGIGTNSDPRCFKCFGIPSYKNIIDCGTNEELFLALAALRDDSDYMQWFTDGRNLFLCDLDSFSEWLYSDWDGECGIKDINKFHKATPQELIEHFNN